MDKKRWQRHCWGRQCSQSGLSPTHSVSCCLASPWSMLFSVPCPLCRRRALGAAEFPDRLKTSHLKHNRLFLWMLLLFCSALQKQLNRGGQL